MTSFILLCSGKILWVRNHDHLDMANTAEFPRQHLTNCRPLFGRVRGGLGAASEGELRVFDVEGATLKRLTEKVRKARALPPGQLDIVPP